MESQRQWLDLATLRTTPALLGLISLVTLWAGHPAAKPGPTPERVGWCPKPLPTLGDALALVRRDLWTARAFAISPDDQTPRKVPADLFDRLLLFTAARHDTRHRFSRVTACAKPSLERAPASVAFRRPSQKQRIVGGDNAHTSEIHPALSPVASTQNSHTTRSAMRFAQPRAAPGRPEQPE